MHALLRVRCSKRPAQSALLRTPSSQPALFRHTCGLPAQSALLRTPSSQRILLTMLPLFSPSPPLFTHVCGLCSRVCVAFVHTCVCVCVAFAHSCVWPRYKFNARILKYPGPPSKNCSAYDVCSLTGVVSLTPVVVDGDIDESQVRVKLIANGILGNITMVSLHDGVSCDYRNEVYTEMYKQQPAKIYGMKEWESGDLDEEATTATPLVTLAVSPTKVVYVSGSQPYVSSFRFKKDQTCTPDGGVFGDDLEDVKSATVSDRNISGLVHLTAKSSSVVEVSMALSVSTGREKGGKKEREKGGEERGKGEMERERARSRSCPREIAAASS